MAHEELSAGYFRFAGNSLDQGYMGARQQATALGNIDSIVRMLLIKQDPSLKRRDFEIPVLWSGRFRRLEAR